MTTSSTPDRGRALLMSTAAASFVLSAALVAGPALAQNECGAAPAGGGTVTCAGNTTFAHGITYTPTADLTVVTQDTDVVNGPITVTGATGNFTVNNAAPVTPSAASLTGGIGVSSTTGNATINNSGTVSTTTADTPGLFAASSAGAVTVNSTGTVSTTGTSTSPLIAGSNSDGVIAVATGGGGATTVNVNNVSATGANASGTGLGSTGVLAENYGSGPVTVTVAQGGTVTAAGDGVAMLSTSSETLNNNGTINAGAGAYSVITASGGSAAVINNYSTGTINGPISLNGGLPGATGGNTVNNAGTWNVTGTSTFGATGTTNVVNNGGLIAVAPDEKTAQTVTFANLATFNNTITTANGTTGGVIDVSHGSTLDLAGAQFNGGDGSTLRISANSPSGELVLGSTGTGTTQVVLADVPGTNPAMNLKGQTVVDGDPGTAGPSNGTFFLGPPGSLDQHAGFVDYRLVYNQATDGTPASYSLFGLPGQEVFEALNIPYALQDFWRHSAFTLTTRQMSIRDSQVGDTPSRAPGWEFWATPYGGEDYFKRPQTFQFAGFQFPSVGIHNDTVGLQVGADMLGHFGSGNGFLGIGGAGTGYWGFTAGVEQQTSHFQGDEANDLYTVGGNIGLYGGATWGGFYANAVGKVDFANMNTNFATAGNFSPTNTFKAYGTRGEVGYRWPWGGFFVEPSARVNAIWTDGIDLHPAGALLHFNSGNASVDGEVGGRVGTTFNFGRFFPGPVSQFNPFPGQFNIYFGAWWADQWDGQNLMSFTTFGGVNGPTTIGLAQRTTGSFIHSEYGLETADWYGGLKLFLKGENNFSGDSVGGWSAQAGVRWAF